jgi:uncharacterized radical SAM superfamily Fe-S cluster-containing enzyme
MLRLLTRGGPALCNVAVTNACNVACDFCIFARGKVGSSNLRWIDTGQFGRALDILRKRDIRYINFFGGEPLLHARLADMISMVVKRDMGSALITNGWLLASQLEKLAADCPEHPLQSPSLRKETSALEEIDLDALPDFAECMSVKNERLRRRD